MVWCIFLGDLLGGTQLDHEITKSVPMQRGARSVLRRSVPMQCGARFFLFCGYRSMVQHGLNEGGQKHIYIYITNAILLFFKMKGTPGGATETILKNTICKTRFENECFVRSPGELFGVHLGWSIFWCAQSRCSGGTPKMFKNILR